MRLSAKSIIASFILLVGAAACTEPSPGDSNGWDVGSDTADDTGSHDSESNDTGSETDGGGEEYEVTFELVNNSGQSVYAYRNISGLPVCGVEGYWVTVTNGGASPLRLTEDCSVCDCSEGDDCVRCARDCPAPSAEQYELPDGQSRSFTWDATAWNISPDGCESPESMVGEGLQAAICYSHEYDPSTQKLVDEKCEIFNFTVDQPTQTIRMTIDPPEPSDVTFKMVNESGRDLYARPQGASTGGGCYGSWYTLGDGEETYSVRNPCSGYCKCDLVEQNPEEQCGVTCAAEACAPPSRETFVWPAGSELVDAWDGTITVQGEVAGQICDRQIVPPTDELVAEFCWSDEVDVDESGAAMLSNETCEAVPFDRLTDRVVEHRVQ